MQSAVSLFRAQIASTGVVDFDHEIMEQVIESARPCCFYDKFLSPALGRQARLKGWNLEYFMARVEKTFFFFLQSIFFFISKAGALLI